MSGKKGATFVWTQPVLDRLETLIIDGLTDIEIAGRLKKSRNAVKLARQKHLRIMAGDRFTFSDTKNARQIAKLLGIGCSKTVISWITNGWLTARTTIGASRNFQYQVRDEDLMAFLQSPEYWQRWSPNRMQDDGWREWATDIRNGVSYLTTGQVGNRLGVKHSTVWTWIHDGLLPAVRHANWLVREADLVGFVPPCERQREYRPRRRTAA